jgi:hypothetical protein
MKCNRCLIDDSIKGVKIDGDCDFCKIHDYLEKESAKFDLDKFIKKIKNTKNKYHCLIGISGGLDSSFMLEYTVKTLGLNPLVIHFDNNFNGLIANYNIERFVKGFNVDFMRYHINEDRYNDVCTALLYASVPDADIANDMVMSELMIRTAKMYKIKYIFNGHDFRNEGSSPLSWTYMDAQYVKSVYQWYWNKPLVNFPMVGFWQQLFQKVQQFRLLYYIDYNPEKEAKRLEEEYEWINYGTKHSENIYTEFVGSYLLPQKFGIDKRITYLSARVRSGMISKKTALELLNKPIEFDESKLEQVLYQLGISEDDFNLIMKFPINDHTHFKTYHDMFKRYRVLMWLLMKMRIVPYTFYKKYCK